LPFVTTTTRRLWWKIHIPLCQPVPLPHRHREDKPMAALRLRPFIRLANAAAQRPRALNGVSGFSTISMHQLKHPAPASASTRYLPRFLDPRIYWQSSKSDSKAKGPQGKKPWNPATFYIVRQALLPAAILWHDSTWVAPRLISRLAQAIFLLIGSQAIQIIALRLNHDERMRRANVKIAVLKEVIERLQRGEDVDVEGMLGVGNEKDEKSWEDGMRPEFDLCKKVHIFALLTPLQY
jgi:hypothetical protein